MTRKASMMKKIDEAPAVTWREDVAAHIVKLAVDMEQAAAQARAHAAHRVSQGPYSSAFARLATIHKTQNNADQSPP